MKNQLFLFLSICFLISSCASSRSISVNQEPVYNLSLVKGVHRDTSIQKDAIVLFSITPKNPIDWPPVLSMRVTYSVNGGEQKAPIDIQKDSRIRFIIYGKNIAEKAPEYYARIKDNLDLEEKGDLMLLAMIFDNISDVPIETMTITYGPWEKRNTNRRIEETFEVIF